MIQKRLRALVYLAGFILSFHLALPAYINSTFLAQFWNDQVVSLIFIIASAASLVGIAHITTVVKRRGIRRTTLSLIFITLLLSLLLAIVQNPWLVTLIFILFYTVRLLIAFVLDIYLEDLSEDRETGGIRGLFLTLGNVAWLFSPLLAGFLVDGNNFGRVFLVSGLTLLPLGYVVGWQLKAMVDPHYEKTSLWEGLKVLWCRDGVCDESIRSSLILSFILNLFYAFMIIYTPLYLTQTIGFTWPEIGIIFTWMLLPFPLIEYPLGKVADKYWGEKELLSAGLIITGLSTLAIPFIVAKSILWWSVILFTTRVGAAMIEAMSESYFFKHVSAQNVYTISFFRNAGPLAYLVAPLIATVVLAVGSYQVLFALVGTICLFGLKYSLTLVDTK